VRAALVAAKRSDVWKPETGARPKLFYLNSKFTNTAAEDGKVSVVSEWKARE